LIIHWWVITRTWQLFILFRWLRYTVILVPWLILIRATLADRWRRWFHIFIILFWLLFLFFLVWLLI
jgi:hypothetical protein